MEADTVIGKKGKIGLLILNDRKSRFFIAREADQKTAECINMEMIKAFEGIKVKSVTPDREKEFTGYAEVIKALNRVQFYFSRTPPAMAARNK